MRKKTYSEVKEYIENFGYKLLSDYYEKASAKLEIECPKGHKYNTSFNNFQKGSRCPICKGNIKHSYEYIKSEIESEGYTLLSNKYKNCKTKLLIKCDKGHKFEMNWNNFQQGQRCPQCAYEHIGECFKLSYKEVKEYIENEGYELLSSEYKNAMTKLLIKCPHNHKFEMNWNSFQRGYRCKKCSDKIRGDKQRFSYDYVKQFIEKEGYKLLSDNYINNSSKLLIQCPNPNHKPYEVTFNNFRQGQRCSKCSGVAKYTFEEVKEYIENEGYTLLSNEYKNCKTKLLIKCDNPNHKPYEVTFDSFNRGSRCPICNESKGEKEVANILDKYNVSYGRQYKFNDCKFYRHLPFDFYLPKYNCCIEYDGCQHYKIVDYFGGFDGFVNTIIRDTIKNEYCKKNNIKLIRIPYWDFNKIKVIILNNIINN